MIFPEDKIKLVGKIIEDFHDINESDTTALDSETLVECINSIINYGDEGVSV